MELRRTRAWGENVESKLEGFRSRKDESTMARFWRFVPKLARPIWVSETNMIIT